MSERVLLVEDDPRLAEMLVSISARRDFAFRSPHWVRRLAAARGQAPTMPSCSI